MKNLLICLIPFVCLSCYIPKDLSRGKPVSEDVIAEIQPEKKYKINQKSGVKIYLSVTRVDSLNVYGKADYYNKKGHIPMGTYYNSTFKDLIKSSDEIYLLKFNPWITFTPIILLTAIMAINFEVENQGP